MEQGNNQVQAAKLQGTQLTKLSPNSLIRFVRTSEEMDLVKACDDVKIKAISKEDAERLIEVVGKWGFYMGTSARLSSDDILLICKFLRDNYSYLSINEINLAINLNLKGHLGKHEYFGTLSPLYISDVLNSYIDYKREIVQPLFQRRDKENYKEPPKLTKEETHKMVCDAIRYEYGKFKQGKSINDVFSIIYDFLEKSGRLNVGDETREKAKQYASRGMEKLADKTNKSIGDLIESSLSKEARFNSLSKNYIVMDLFSNINNIEEYISNIKLEEIS